MQLGPPTSRIRNSKGRGSEFGGKSLIYRLCSYPLPKLTNLHVLVNNLQAQSSSSEESRREEVNGSGSGSDDKKVDVPDPNEPSGFDRGFTPQEIMGATEMEGKILFLMKWLVQP